MPKLKCSASLHVTCIVNLSKVHQLDPPSPCDLIGITLAGQGFENSLDDVHGIASPAYSCGHVGNASTLAHFVNFVLTSDAEPCIFVS